MSKAISNSSSSLPPSLDNWLGEDEEAREAGVMKTNTGFAYAYNAQAVVDDTHQVIIVVDVTQ